LAYPFAPMPKDPLVRGHIVIDGEACTFCGVCGKKCPTDAITVNRDEKEWEISRFGCILCGACAEVCPKKCLSMSPELTPASDVHIRDKVKGRA